MPDDLFRYPFSHDGAVVFFAIVASITHLLIWLGVLTMWRSGAIGAGNAARRGVMAVLAGTGLLFVCEWASILLMRHSTHYGWSHVVLAGFGVASLAVTFGMLAIGVVALRAWDIARMAPVRPAGVRIAVADRDSAPVHLSDLARRRGLRPRLRTARNGSTH